MSKTIGDTGPAIVVLVLAAGRINHQQSGDEYPLCLTEINGVSVLESIVRRTSRIGSVQYAFTFLESEARRFHLDKIASLLAPGSRSIRVPELTQGSACTALLAACQIDPEAELLIVSANELVDLDFAEPIENFRSRMLDGGTLVFRSVHPRYSYVRLNEQGFVTQAAQREPISSLATAGVFWFARTHLFVDAAKSMIQKEAQIDGSYFVAPTFNELILKHKRVGVWDLDVAKYIPLKTERLVEQHESGRSL